MNEGHDYPSRLLALLRASQAGQVSLAEAVRHLRGEEFARGAVDWHGQLPEDIARGQFWRPLLLAHA